MAHKYSYFKPKPANSKKEAVETGNTQYYTRNKPCIHGHTLRRTSTGHCIHCETDRRRAKENNPPNKMIVIDHHNDAHDFDRDYYKM